MVEQGEQLMDTIREQLNSIKSWDHLCMKTDNLTLLEKYHKMLTISAM